MKHQNHHLKRLAPWLWGILAASLLLLGLALWMGMRYAGSDDAPILRSFMGYEGGRPAQYHLYIHTLLAWLLHGLALLAPGVAWFSLVQLFSLWFSCVVIIKSLIQCALRHRLPLWGGLAAGLVFLFSFSGYILCRISYTSTAALLGAAAVCQLLSAVHPDATGRQMVRGMALSIALLLSCYCLRQISALPPLAFWLLAMALIWRQHFSASKRSLRPLRAGLLLCLLGFGLLAGIRAIEIKALGLEDYLAWQNARIAIFDYTDFVHNTDPAALEAFGWSANEFYLVGQWFFMDSNITTEALEAILALQPTPPGLGVSLANAWETADGFFRGYPAYAYGGTALVLIALALLWRSLRRRQWIQAAATGAALLGGAILLGYLGYRGRLPLRAAVSVLLPLGGFLLMQWLSPLPAAKSGPACAPSRSHRLQTLFCGLLAAGLCLYGSSFTVQWLTTPEDPETLARTQGIPETMDSFALDNPDMLIIYDITCVQDTRLFPDTSLGIPGNLMFWGGYPARSPSWMYQLAQYGVDGASFTAQDFLRDNLVVASAVGQPNSTLLGYITDQLGVEIDWSFYSEDGYVVYIDLYEY